MTEEKWEKIKEGILLATDGIITDVDLIKGIEEITGKEIDKFAHKSMFIDPRMQTPIIVV